MSQISIENLQLSLLASSRGMDKVSDEISAEIYGGVLPAGAVWFLGGAALTAITIGGKVLADTLYDLEYRKINPAGPR